MTDSPRVAFRLLLRYVLGACLPGALSGCISTLAHSESELAPGEIIAKGLRETDILASTGREHHSKLFIGLRSDGEIWTNSNLLDAEQLGLFAFAFLDLPFTCIADSIYSPFDVEEDQHYQHARENYLAAVKKMQEKPNDLPSTDRPGGPMQWRRVQ